MSAPLDRELSSDDPSPFAQKWWRDTEDSELCRQSAGVSSTADDEVYMHRHRVARSLEPTLLLDARSVPRRRPKLMFLYSSLALAFAASVLVANKFPPEGTVAFANDRMIRPPIGFAGPMDLGLELRLADKTIVDRKSLRLEWTAAASEQSTGTAIRQLDRQEITDLMRRGREFIVAGDLASARLVLQRAAEAGDPQAALMLAGTYDPIVLEKVGVQGFAPDIVQGFAPDVALARTWYKWAKEFGSTEAARRLEMLVRRDHR